MKFGILSLLLLAAVPALAQDRIFTTTQKAPIEGEVVEMNTNEVKYKPTGRPFPMTTLDKQDVIKIVYANGEVFMISNPLKDFAVYNGQHRWNIKMDLLSPLLGYTNLYLEHSQKPGRSVEYQLNLIGAGKNQMLYSDYYVSTGGNREIGMNAYGAGVGIGMKFLRLPDYVNGAVRLRHILQGTYIKPAISASFYSRRFIAFDQYGSVFVERKPVFSITPTVSIGKQFILDNTISIELFATVGYSFDNVRRQQKSIRNDRMSQPYWYYDNEPFNNFGSTRFSAGDMGLALNGGIRIGYLFDFKSRRKLSSVSREKVREASENVSECHPGARGISLITDLRSRDLRHQSSKKWNGRFNSKRPFLFQYLLLRTSCTS